MTVNTPAVEPAVDPVTVEVIGNAISSITEEMGETLVRASYSTNIKERRDCSTVIFDAQGRTLHHAEHIPIHLGSLMGLVETILDRYPRAEIEEGDVFIGNDAYNGGGTHLPDIVLAAPIFFHGDIVGWVTNLAHHADFVDRSHAHIFQEGLRIPPIRLQRAGEMQRDVLDLILLNCQVPRERLNDLRAQMEARTPMRSLGEVEDIAVAALYLASPASRWVTGRVLAVDGGTDATNWPFEMKED